MLKQLKKCLPKHLSIKKKLFFLRIGMGIGMGLIIAGLSFGISASILHDYLVTDLGSTAKLAASQIELMLHNAGRNVAEMAKSDEMEKYSLTGRTELLLKLLKKNHTVLFDKISCSNGKGMVETAFVSGRIEVAEHFAGPADSWQPALKKPNTLIIQGPVYDDDIQKNVLQFFYRHINYFDKELNILHASVSLDTLSQSINKMFDKEDRYSIIITNSNKRIIYGPQSQDFGKSGAGILPHFLDEELEPFKAKYMGSLSIYGKISLVAVYPISDPAWNIFVIKSVDSIKKPLYNLFFQIFFAALIILICGELISRKLGAALLEPIAKLQKAISHIMEHNDLKKRVKWHSQDEMGQLADSFNSMLEKIDKTQNRLQDEQQFIENIINSMAGLMIAVSPEWKILKINPKVCSHFGYTKDELIGQPFHLLSPMLNPMLSPNHHPLLTKEEKAGLAEQKVVEIQGINMHHKTHRSLPLSLKISALTDYKNTLIGYLLIAHDIRDKLRFQEEKRVADEKLREAREDLLKTEKLAIVGQMSGMIAHDVLNPISSIYARLELNIREEEDNVKVHKLLHSIISEWQQKVDLDDDRFNRFFKDKGQRDLLILQKIADSILQKDQERAEEQNFIYQLIQKIIKIIDNLREMSRRKNIVEEFDLVKLIDEVIEDMNDRFKKKEIRVHKDYQAHPRLNADYIAIYSVFSNLLKNAMQAINDTGADKSKDKKISIKLYQDKDKVFILIKDTGIGIESKIIKNIFKVGFSNKGREGTGLGLSYSRKIAREFNGDIVLLDSIQGQGSIFQITFYL